MKAKYTAVQVLGVVIACLGLSVIGMQAVPRSQAIPSVPLSSLGLASDHAQQAAVIAANTPKFQIVGADGQDNTKKNVRLWDAMIQVRGSHLPNIAQQIGDCVSWGAAHAIDYLQAVQMVRGPPGFEFAQAFPPYIYGTSRVQVGKNQIRGDGSVGAWAAQALRDYGCLRSDAPQCPPYSGSIATSWGRSGPPQWALTEAKPFSVKSIAQVNSAEEARDAICNGYPVTIASSWWGTNRITPVDGRMVATRNTSWGHQQCIIGYDGSGRTPYFYVLNSWGENAHPAPLQNEPPGGYWVRFADIDHICKEGDSWALSSFEGFPADVIDWGQLLHRTVSASGPDVPHVETNGDGIMLESVFAIGIGLLLVLAGIALFRWAGTARKNLAAFAGFAGLLIGGGILNAQQPDFATASIRHEAKIDWSSAKHRSFASAPQLERVTDDMWGKALIRQAEPAKVVAERLPHPQALFFTQKSCVPCMAPKEYVRTNLVPLGWTAGEDELADFRIIDIEKYPSIAAKYKVEQTPTTVFLDRYGHEVERISGPNQQLDRWTKVMNRYR